MGTCFCMWHFFFFLRFLRRWCANRWLWTHANSNSDGSQAFNEILPTRDALGQFARCRKMCDLLRGRSPRYIFPEHTHQLPHKCIYLKICWDAQNGCDINSMLNCCPFTVPLYSSSAQVSSLCQANYLTLTWDGREALDPVAVCNLERKALKQWSSSNVGTADALDSKLELQGGGCRHRDYTLI